MEDNTKEQAQQIVLDMVQLLQGANAKDGMSALDTVLGNLLMIRRTLVGVMPAEVQAVYRMELLNILMVHGLSPYDKTEETLHHMGNYILQHKDDICECKAELNPAAEPEAES